MQSTATPVTSLRHQEGRRVFREGPKFFKLCPTHFSRGGGQKFSESPLRLSLLAGLAVTAFTHHEIEIQPGKKNRHFDVRF